MVATVADVLTLADAKRQLGVPADVLDFDDRINDAIGQAVSWVGSLNGVPLVDREEGFGLEASGTEPARIMLPLGWPSPTRLLTIRYFATDGAMPTILTAQGGAAPYQQEVGGDWLVRPSDFGRTEWPSNVSADIRVTVSLASIPERIVAAVVVACRHFYENDPPPTQAVVDLLS